MLYFLFSYEKNIIKRWFILWIQIILTKKFYYMHKNNKNIER